MIHNLNKTLMGFIFGKKFKHLFFKGTHKVVIQTVRHATFTGLKQTRNTKTETGCGAKTNLKQQRWTTSQMETNKLAHC